MSKRAIFFYEHRYLRDRHIDTVRHWPDEDSVLNREHFLARKSSHVTRERSLGDYTKRSWKQILPLINLKRRPQGVPPDATIYVWGGQIATGPQIVELDNPFALTAFNYDAFMWYRPILRALLLRSSVLEIRCISAACRDSLRLLLGEEVGAKASVHYPFVERCPRATRTASATERYELLFVGTQFEIKGGPPLLRAFRRLHDIQPNSHLTIITHLPPEYRDLASHPAITVIENHVPREELRTKYLAATDILVHPTLQDSFGMVPLEAVSCGCAVVATNVYALPEMVIDGMNGRLIQPPVCGWNGTTPTPALRTWYRFKSVVRKNQMGKFEEDIRNALLSLVSNPEFLIQCMKGSYDLFESRFALKNPHPPTFSAVGI